MSETSAIGDEGANWRATVRDSLLQHPRDHLALWVTLLILLAASGAATYRHRSSRAATADGKTTHKTPNDGVGDDAAQYVSDGPLQAFCVRHSALQRDNALCKTPIRLDTSYVRALALHVPYYYAAYFRDVDFGPVLVAIAVGEFLVNDNPWSVVPLLAFAALHAARQTFAVSNVLYDQTCRNNRTLERARYGPAVGAYRVARVRRRDLERGDLVLVSRTSSPTLPADLLLLRGRLFTDESQAFGEDAIQHRDGVLSIAAAAAAASSSDCNDTDLASWLTKDFQETLRACRLSIRHRSAGGSVSIGATRTGGVDDADRGFSPTTVTRRLRGADANFEVGGDDKREQSKMTPATTTTTTARYGAENVAFADTIVRDGAALGVVIETGGDAHVHRAAPNNNGGRRGNTTLAKRRLDRISTVTFAALVVLSACSALVTHHQARHAHSFAALVMLMALLFNSMIPLSLPFVLDCADAVLAERLASKHGGRVRFNRHGQNAHQARPTEIVSDKTGTLTTNRVTLAYVLGTRRTLDDGGGANDNGDAGDDEKKPVDDRIECRAANELAAECAPLTAAVMACTGLLVAPALGVVRSDVLDAELLRRLPCTLVRNGRLSGDASECGGGAESSDSDDTVWALRGPESDSVESADRRNTDGNDNGSSSSSEAESKDGKKATAVGRLTRVRYRPFTHALGCKLAVTRARSADDGKCAYTLHVQGSPSAMLRYMSNDDGVGGRRQLQEMLAAAEQLPVAAGTYRKILAYASRPLGDSFSNATSDRELLAELRAPLVYVFADGIVADIRESIRQLLESSPEMRFTMLSGDSRASCVETGVAIGVVNTTTTTTTEKTAATLENSAAEKEMTSTTAAAGAGPGKIIEVRELDDAAAAVAEIASERVDVGVAARTLVLNGELLAALTRGSDAHKRQLRALLAATRTRVVYRAPPQGKQQFVAFVKQHLGAETLMAGDGANDVAAIERADVGVAIHGGESSLATEAAHVVVDSWREIPAFVARCREPQLVVQVAAQWTVMRSMMTSFTNLSRLLLSNFVTLKSRGAGNVGHLMPLVNASVFAIVMSYVYDESLLRATTDVAATNADGSETRGSDGDGSSGGGDGLSVRIDMAALAREVAEAERREKRLSFVRILTKGAVISVVDACLVLPARRNDLRTLVSIHILQLLLQLYAFKRTGWTRRSLLLHAAIVAAWGIWHAFVCGIRAGDLWSLVATWLIFLS